MLNKKILSLILAFCITVGNIQGYALELDNVCPEEVGTYNHDICAFMKGKELLTKGNDYVGIKNVGKDADQSLYFFSYRALDKIIDKFKIYSEEEIKKIFPCDPFPWEVKNEKKSNGLLNLLGTGAVKLAGITIGSGLMLLANLAGCFHFFPNFDEHARFLPGINAIFKFIPDAIGGFSVNKLMVILGGLFGSLVEVEVDNTIPYSESSHKNFLEQERLRRRAENNACALNSLKYKIPADFDFRKSENDFILLQFCESDLYSKGIAEFNKAGIKYSDEEKASFAPKFEELRKNLTEVLKNNRYVEVE